MGEALAGLGTAITFVWDSFATTITTFNAYPVLWIGCAVGIVASIIKLVKSAVKVGGRRR